MAVAWLLLRLLYSCSAVPASLLLRSFTIVVLLYGCCMAAVEVMYSCCIVVVLLLYGCYCWCWGCCTVVVDLHGCYWDVVQLLICSIDVVEMLCSCLHLFHDCYTAVARGFACFLYGCCTVLYSFVAWLLYGCCKRCCMFAVWLLYGCYWDAVQLMHCCCMAVVEVL